MPRAIAAAPSPSSCQPPTFAARKMASRLPRSRRGAQPRVVPAADLGGQEDVVAVAALAHPAPEQRLALATFALINPDGVVVGGVEETPAGVVVAVEDGERRPLVDRGAEEHRAEAERADGGARVAEG